MNENKRLTDQFKEWLGAYVDGELTPERAAWVEAHLEDCPECRRELEDLRALTSLLHAGDEALDAALASGMGAISAGEKIAARAGGRTPGRSNGRALLRYFPLLIFGGWAFTQVVLLVTGALRFLQVLVPGSWLGWLLPDPSATSWLPTALCSWLPDSLLCQALDEIARLPLPGGVGLISLLLTALAVMLFLSWLAGMWTHQRTHQRTHQQALPSGHSETA